MYRDGAWSFWTDYNNTSGNGSTSTALFISTGGSVNVVRGDIQIGGTTVIDSSKNLLNLESIKLFDNKELLLGNSSDVRFLHNGTDTHILNNTGDLFISNFADDKDIVFRSDDGSGGVAEYFRLDGGNGYLITSKHNQHLDNVKSMYGGSNDLQIFHNGTESRIEDSGTGNLVIKATNLEFKSYGTNEAYLTANQNGAVTLYHNNVSKLATSSSGIDITGTVVSDGFTVEGDATIKGGSDVSNTGATLQLESTETQAVGSGASISFKGDDGSGTQRVFGVIKGSKTSATSGEFNGGLDFFTRVTAEGNARKRLAIASNGDISFYEDTGTTAKFFWDASAESLGIGETTIDAKLHLTTASAGLINQKFESATSAAWRLGIPASQTYFAFDNANDNLSSPKVVIDASGNFLVGTTNTFPPSDTGNEGVAVKPDNIAISRNASTALFLDRMTSDGTLVDFRKDNTTVGSIGSYSSGLDIAGSSYGVRFAGSTIFPVTSAGSVSNGAVDLGYSSGRFKDLHLSGTVNAGSIASSVTATTQSAGDNSTKVATTAYTDTAIANLADSAPGTLNTLNELAAALGDDANFSTTVTNSIATKLPLAGGTMTGALNMGSQNITNTGTITFDGGTTSANLNFGDGDKAVFGNSSDLQIYHDGSHSYVRDVGTGNLRLQGTNLNLQNEGGTKNYLVATNGGAVTLYHNNLPKFETTSGGASITGELDTTGNIAINKDVAKLTINNNVSNGQAGIDIKNTGLHARYILDGDDLFRIYNQTSGFDTFAVKSDGDLYMGSTKWFDLSRNLTNIGTISSGNITTSGFVQSNNSTAFTANGSGVILRTIAPAVESGHTTKHEMNYGWASTNDRTYQAPKIDGTANYSHEFGYDFANENWYFDDLLSVGTISSGAITSTGDIEVRSGNKLILQRPNNGIASNISTDSTGAMILDSLNGEGFFFNNAGTNAFKLDPINATFAGKVTINEGNVADQLVIYRTSPSSNQVGMKFDVHGVHSRFFGVGTDGHPYWSTTADLTGAGNGVWHSGLSNFKVGTVSVLTSSRNLQNIGTISSGAITTSGKFRMNLGANPSPATTDYLYIGGDDLGGSDAAIYLGNRGNGTGYGWRFFYEGSGNSNNNKLIIKSENLGSPVNALSFTQDGSATFAGTISSGAITANSSGTNTVTIDGTGTKTLRSYHDSGGVGWATGSGTSYTNLLYLDDNNDRVRIYTEQAERLRINATGIDARTGGFRINATTVIDSSRNLTNIGTISSGAITASAPIKVLQPSSSTNNELLVLEADDPNADLIMTDNTGSIRLRTSGSGDFVLFTGGSATSQNASGSTQALLIDQAQNASFAGYVTSSDYLQHFSYLYSRNNLRVLNAAGNGWHDWATRSNGTFNLNVGTISSGNISSGAITSTGNTVFTGSGSSGYAFEVKRGSDGSDSFRVLNTGEVLVNNNYFYVTSSQGSYFQNAARFRGGISNDTSGVALTVGDDLNVDGLIQISGTNVLTNSRALVNINSISSGAITSTGAISAEDNIYLTDAGTVRGKLLLNASDRDNVELRAESLGSTMKFFTVGTQALLLNSSQNATFAGTIQNGSVWINDGTNFNNYDENIRLFNPANNVSVIAFSATGTGGVPTTSILGYSDRFETRLGSTWRSRLYSSGLYVNGGYYVGGTEVISSARNLTNIGTISSGDITTSGDLYLSEYIYHTGDTDTYIRIQDNSWTFRTGGGDRVVIDNSEMTTKDINVGGTGNASVKVRHIEGKAPNSASYEGLYLNYNSTYPVFIGQSASNSDLYLYGALRIGSTAVIDASRNMSNIGTISSARLIVNSGANVSQFHSHHTTGHDDWQVSPISIRERGLNTNNSTNNQYSPNLNFHWSSVVSRSLTMTSDGNFTLGEWTASGTPEMSGNLSFLNTAGYRVNNTNVIDSSRNLTNIGTISSGTITANGGGNQHEFTSSSDGPLITKSTDATTGIGFTDNSATDYIFYRGSLNHFYTNSGTLGIGLASVGTGQKLNVAGGIGISGSTVIDSARNLTNIGYHETSSTTPHRYTANGNTGTYNKTVTYINQNNTSGSTANGMFIEMGRITDSSSAEVRHFVVGARGGQINFKVNGSGTGTFTGDVVAYSDERLKSNIQTLDGKKALQMRGVSFEKDGKNSSGVIAQEIEKIAPELVHTNDDEMSTKSVAYGNLVGYLIEAVKDQQKEIEYMKLELKLLKENNNGD
jgi:hypothetical protein